MNHDEIKSIAKVMGPVIREFTEATQKPLADRLNQVVTRLDAMATRLDTAVGAKHDEGRYRGVGGAFDGKAFGEDIVAAVKTHVAGAVAPILARTDALERRMASLPTVADIEAEVARQVAGALAARPAPKDGKSVTAADVAPMIEAEVAAAIARVKQQARAAPHWRAPSPADNWPAGLGPIIDITPAPEPQLEHHIASAVALLPRPAN